MVTLNVVQEQGGVEMTDELERRWDDAMEGAWTGFRTRLADRLAALEEGSSLCVEVPDDEELLGAAPYCQVRLDAGWLRVEAVSNEFLDERYALDEEQQAALVALGLEEPDKQSPNYWVDLEQRQADRAAFVMVEALRHVYGVVHPVYLEAEGLESGVSRLASLAPQPPTTPALGIGEETQFPGSGEELMAALQAVAGEVLGHEAVLDEDGDLPMATEQTVFYVTVSPHAPRVLIHGTLVVEVVHEQRALVEVNLLNRSEFGLTFVLADGSVTVRRELPMTAFVPNDVRMELTRLCADADRWVSDLIDRVGGRGMFDGDVRQPRDRRRTPSAEDTDQLGDERFEQALKVLQELEGEERGSVDAATIARIFHGDRDLLLEASQWALSRGSRWGERRRKAETEDKTSFAKGCRAQQRYYHQLRARIRKALRSVVQAPVKRELPAQLSLFAEDEAGS